MIVSTECVKVSLRLFCVPWNRSTGKGGVLLRKNIKWKTCAAAGIAAFMVFCHGDPPLQAIGTETGAEECQNFVRNFAENRRLLMELVSGNQETGRHEFCVEGEDYVPDTLVIAQTFPQVSSISNTVLTEYRRDGHRYTRCRIGFEWNYEEKNCVHRWNTEILEENDCLTCGRERIWCGQCGREETAVLPAMGHMDRDKDALCDRCGARFLEQKAGDILRVLYETPGSSTWLNFICRDENYEGGMLYVCEEPFELDGPEETIRWWLRMDFENYISVRSACRKVLMADQNGRIIEDGEWKSGQEIWPAVLLETPVTGETAEQQAWETGDIQIRTIGKENYLFRCVDEDYGDSNSNYQKTALFLCDTVIRSDIDSTNTQKTILEFGKDNNYKTSKIRQWLGKKTFGSRFDLMDVYTGVNSACFGKTVDMEFGQTDGGGLLRQELPYQLIEDCMFLLSVEEALKYVEYLWRFAGSEEQNPETQLSPYSRGYWLRTPAFEKDGNGNFQYGEQIYTVDLENGCLRPVDIHDGSMGIRPAFCVPQA